MKKHNRVKSLCFMINYWRTSNASLGTCSPLLRTLQFLHLLLNHLAGDRNRWTILLRQSGSVHVPITHILIVYVALVYYPRTEPLNLYSEPLCLQWLWGFYSMKDQSEAPSAPSLLETLYQFFLCSSVETATKFQLTESTWFSLCMWETEQSFICSGRFNYVC